MTQTFDNWTEYDNWLIVNYDKYAIYNIIDSEGRITAEYMDKDEWLRLEKEKSDSE